MTIESFIDPTDFFGGKGDIKRQQSPWSKKPRRGILPFLDAYISSLWDMFSQWLFHGISMSMVFSFHTWATKNSLTTVTHTFQARTLISILTSMEKKTAWFSMRNTTFAGSRGSLKNPSPWSFLNITKELHFRPLSLAITLGTISFFCVFFFGSCARRLW